MPADVTVVVLREGGAVVGFCVGGVKTRIVTGPVPDGVTVLVVREDAVPRVVTVVVLLSGLLVVGI